jgi:hypothetical protein
MIDIRGFLAVLAALFALAALVAGPAQAYEHVEPGFSALNIAPSNTQAGGHPNVKIDFTMRIDKEGECKSDCLYARRESIHWPEGFIGNPHVAPKCSLSEFNTASCPSDSQVGTFLLDLEGTGLFVPLYNMETRPDQAGELGFSAPLLNVPIFLELSSRTNDDYGLEAVSTPQLRLPFNHLQLELWGVPASEEHRAERFFTPLSGLGACEVRPEDEGCPPGTPFGSFTFAPATVSPAPFLQNPTTCGVPLTVSATVEYYGGLEGRGEEPWPSTTGCNQASFTPSVTAQATTTSADTAAGLDAELKIPQTQSPITPAPSEVRVTRVTLPEGFSINPGAADGKVACPESSTAIGTLFAATCPEDSKIGTLMLDVAALPEPIPGALYLAEPKPGEPYRVLLAASGFATNIKLLGRVDADPHTGQLSMVFEHLPQSPLQEFDLHIFGSERGLLATPTQCGEYSVESEFVPWNTALNTRITHNAIFVNSGPGGTACPNGARPFHPGFEAGVENNTAGRHSTFSVVVDRSDGEQNLTHLTVNAPPGFSATLKGVPYCPESAIAALGSAAHTGVAEQNSPACPPASQIGTADTFSGAGTHPLSTPGKVYLAGPYEGAPLSLVVVVPAVSGPYDLGNAVVRAAIDVDPTTAQVTAVSDPLPKILEGIPLRIRSVVVSLDRPNFALNPTNCSSHSVAATIGADEGGSVNASSPFQVANCAALPFAPKLGLKLTGATKRTGNPALQAVLTAQPGDANIATTTVTMPHALFLDNSHVGNPCTRVQFAANACPASSVLGTAEAETPLLDKPLAGPVYLMSGYGHKLPDLIAALKGQIDVNLDGRIDAVHQRLRTRFQSIPDVPVTRFTLKLAGGKKGLLVNSENLCTAKPTAAVKFGGQNGRGAQSATPLQLPCGKKARRHRPGANGAKAGR